ncbi:MAG TPA: 6-phosphofructokinase [Lacipirellulaceae bacterium]|nr:6-phosphofructokinase [Lacipirellulaceae bacterium]
MKIGVLTGGGDCPGLNAVIRAIVRKGIFHYGDTFLGFSEGWRGVFENKTEPLDLDRVSGILPRGGTILRTSRTNPAKREGGIQRCLDNLKANKLDALITLGGDDTMSVSLKLFEAGFHVIGVPKTIDNDLSGTDFCFGFDTAVEIATEAIDRLHTTAEAHNRVIVVEVMGRDSGWIAMYSGIAGGADVILIPERPIHLDEVASAIKLRHSRGRYFSIVVVAEGAKLSDSGDNAVSEAGLDEFGHVRLGGIGNLLAKEIEKRTGFETRATVLGHVQRGGTPSGFDRVLATRYGIGAIDMVHRGEWGRMAALKSNEITSIPLKDALGVNRKVDDNLIEIANSLQDKVGGEKQEPQLVTK